MIREHAFHTRWWGEPVGVVDDFAFVALPAEERERALSAFAWVELRAPLHAADPLALAHAGFVQIDAQIPFKIRVNRVAGGPSLDELTVERASEHPFTVDAPAPFGHERFRHLPGITAEKIAERFALWSRLQIAAAPEWCLRIGAGGATQGWFLSAMERDGLHLDLAMLHRDATISGAYLYRKSLLAYAALGAQIGTARFSVENTAVMNIYASMGAQFLAPVGIWLWTRRG
jgi:hypothetical protein